MSAILERQNRVIIELLARSTIGVKEIENLVRKGKQKGNPDDFVRVYNQLDGTKKVTDLAKIVNVSRQGMSQVLQTWEEKGIIYNIGTEQLPKYVGLLKLPINNRVNSRPKKGKEEQLEESDFTELQPASPAPQIPDESTDSDQSEGSL